MKRLAAQHSDADDPLVVVGIDGSKAAIRAAEWAIDEAAARNVPLRIIYVSRNTIAAAAVNDTDRIARLLGPHRHPVLGNAECSVLVARPL